MVNSMRANIDHDIFRKKAESRRLDILVRWFLHRQKKPVPDQLPTGYSGLSTQPEWKSSKDALRQTMGCSSENSAQYAYVEKPLTKEQQRKKFNFDEKYKALNQGLEFFVGKCIHHGESAFKVYSSSHKHHCIACREETYRKRNEMNLKGFKKAEVA